jgi:predicted ATP-grasp superfamily ATP-dependent carboligase
MKENALINLHNDLVEDVDKIILTENVKKSIKKRTSIAQVRKEYEIRIEDLKREVELLKNLLKFYLQQDDLVDW